VLQESPAIADKPRGASENVARFIKEPQGVISARLNDLHDCDHPLQ